MKSLLNKVLVVSGLALLALSSCKKDDVKITATSGTPGLLSASATTLVLNSAKLADPATVQTFTFVQANFGYNAAVTNELQIDVPSDNFANPPYKLALGANVFTAAFNTADFNALLLKTGLKGNVAGQVNVRMKSTISGGTTTVYSNVLALNVTPFNLTSWVYVVGNFNGYSTTAPDSLISPTSNGIYTGIINFTAAGSRFLVLPAKNFNNKYATVTNPPTGTDLSLTYATEYVSSSGNDLYAPTTPGYYLITLNTNTNSITVALTNTYSAIGATSADASGYSIDVPLTKYVNDGATGWTGTVGLKVGDFKIRQNNDWSFSWGIPKAGTEGDGVANTLNDTSNTNIPVTVAGNYTVSFNITPFAFGASASSSTPPTKTATYKLVKQ